MFKPEEIEVDFWRTGVCLKTGVVASCASGESANGDSVATVCRLYNRYKGVWHVHKKEQEAITSTIPLGKCNLFYSFFVC